MNRFSYLRLRRILVLTLLISMLFMSIIPASGLGKAADNNLDSIISSLLKSEGTGETTEQVSQAFDIQTVESPSVISSVYGLAAPVLDTLPAVTRDDVFEISGEAEVGALVTVSYSRDEGEVKLVGEATSQLGQDGRGHFTVTFDTEFEGLYVFTAIATLDGQTSTSSEPAVVELDWSIPGDVNDLDWELTAYNVARISWTPPLVEDGEGNYVSDPSVQKYKIFDSTGQQLTETELLEYSTGVLEENQRYEFMVRAVDLAGNTSEGYRITVAASPKAEVKLVELGVSGSSSTSSIAISNDGSKVAFLDSEHSTSNDAAAVAPMVSASPKPRHLYVADTTTKEKQVVSATRDNKFPDSHVGGASLSDNGNIVAFSSNASNLLAAPLDADGIFIYVYDRINQTMELVSKPNAYAGEPAISGDGGRIAYTEDDRIYVYDRTSKSSKLVSETTDGQAENGNSSHPVISADGNFIAFFSNSTNLKGGVTAWAGRVIYVYDVTAGEIIHHFTFHQGTYSMSINEDGTYIAYTAYQGDTKRPFLIDVVNGSLINLNEGRPPEQFGHKDYTYVSISGDGQTIFTNFYDYSPMNTNDSMERFQRISGEIEVEDVGNPALYEQYGVMDQLGNRIAYVRNHSIYVHCSWNCSQTDPEGSITSVRWMVPLTSRVADQLKPGSEVTIQASGQSGLSVEAEVSYRQLATSDPSQQEVKAITVTLQEEQGNPGVYKTSLSLAEGTTEITTITARLTNGSGGRAADQLPVKIAGKLEVDIDSDRMSMLDGSQLVISRPSISSSIKVPVSSSQTQYELYLASAEDYSVTLKNNDETIVLAERNGVAIQNARTTSLQVVPAFLAALRVNVQGFYEDLDVVRVIFKDKASGSVVADVEVDEEGVAELTGEHQAGEELVVSVIPPEGLSASPDQTIMLQLGLNELTFILSDVAGSIDTVDMEFSKKIPTDYSPIPVMDSDAKIIVNGETGLALKARVIYQKWNGGSEPEQTDRIIDLSESTPGIYTAPFIMEEGIAEFSSINLQISGSWSPTEFHIGQRVAGRMKINLDIPNTPEWMTDLEQSILSVGHYQSYYKRFFENRQLEAGKLEYTVDVPFVEVPYQVSLSSKNQKMLPVQLQAVVPGYGQTVEVTLAPRFKMKLNGRVTNEAGEKMPISYTLTDSANRVVASESVWGDFTLQTDSIPGEKYQLKVKPSHIHYYIKIVEITFDTPDKSIDVVLQPKPVAGLVGRIFTKEQQPAAGAAVTATLIQEGLSKTYYTKTGPDGTYLMQIPTGIVQLRATGHKEIGYMTPLTVVEIPETGNVTADLKLLDYAQVTFNLYTRYTGSGWEGPIPLDQGTISRMRLGLQSSELITKYGNPLQVRAVQGDTIRICIYGIEGVVPRTCQEAQIGEDNTAFMEMRMENARAAVTIEGAIKANGELSSHFRYDLYRVQDNLFIGSQYVNNTGTKHRIPLPASGEYRMIIEGQDRSKATLQFTAISDHTIDLGVIQLQAPGKFSGQSGNMLSVSSDRVVTNSRLTARLSYTNHAVASAQAENARLILEFPSELSVAPGTLVVNGQAVTPVVHGQSLEVPLGSIPGQASGSAQVQLLVGDTGTKPSVALHAKIRYKSASVEQEELLGSALVNLVPVTLRAPKLVSKPQFLLSGIAPANSEVTVYDGGLVLGRSNSSPVGTWNMPVEITELTSMKHKLRAETVIAGKRISGEEATVIYDPTDAGLEEISMKQSGSSLETFRPEDGVAVFPYVVVPGNPFTFQMKFRDPSRISNVVVQFGSGFADAQLKDGVFIATMGQPLHVGPIEVTYDTKRLEWNPERDLHSPPSEEEVRENIHSSLRNYETNAILLPGEGGNPADTATIQTRMTEDIAADIKYKMSRVAGYTPTAQDQQRVQASGLPVYGMKVSHALKGKKGTISFEALIPESALEQDNGVKTAFELMGKALNAEMHAADKNHEVTALAVNQLASGGMIKVGITLSLSILKGNIEDIWLAFEAYWNLKTISEEPEIFKRVTKDLEWAQSLCDPALIKYYSDWATEIGNDIMINESIKWGLAVAAVAVAPGTFGLGTIALWGVQYVAQESLNDAVNYKLDALEEAMRKVKCLPKPPKKPQADPKIIWDPSGYVYEGIPDNRLEGVTATAMEQNPVTQEWTVWDAEWYGQKNPLKTNQQGRYAWDVPAGRWKVRYEKDGYVTGYSNELDVPPPQLDVNVPLVSYLPPEVSAIRAEAGGSQIRIYFTKPIVAESLQNGSIIITDNNGADVTGAVYAKNPVTEGGKVLSMVVEFIPDQLMAADDYKVTVDGQIASYAGVALGADFEQNITIVATDTTPPEEAAELTVGLFDQTATLSWIDSDDPDLASVIVRYKKTSDAEFGEPEVVSKGTQWAVIEQLDAEAAYDFHVSSVDAAGNESVGIQSSWTLAPEEPDLTPPSSVRELTVSSATASQLTVSWKDSVDPDLAKLRLSWQTVNGSSSVQSAELVRGKQTHTIPGLASSTAYTIAITAIDHSGNESAEASITAQTMSDSGNSGNGNSGIPGGTTNPGNSGSSSKEWSVGTEEGSFDAFEGEIGLKVPAGTFTKQTKLVVSKQLFSANTLPKSYNWLSQSYVLDAGDTGVKHLMQLSIQYDLTRIKGLDMRRAGIYYKPAVSSSRWVYVGGVWDENNQRLTTDIQELGEYAVLLYEHPFADLSAHWSQADVNVLVSRHIVDGVSEQSFEPDRRITRAEMTKLLVQLMGGVHLQNPPASPVSDSGHSFSDVAADAWYFNHVTKAAELGLVEGDGDLFRPQAAITREELAVLLQRFVRLQGTVMNTADPTKLERFSDTNEVSGWAKGAIGLAISEGWIQGISESTLEPQGEATRAQAAVMLLRVITSLGIVETQT
jgi:hypothetical protein